MSGRSPRPLRERPSRRAVGHPVAGANRSKLMALITLAKDSATSSSTERKGVIVTVQDQGTLDRIQDVMRELQLDDEMHFEATLDSALRRIREGDNPRILIIDLSDSPAPIAERGADGVRWRCENSCTRRRQRCERVRWTPIVRQPEP